MYQKIPNSTNVLEVATGRVIPADAANFDYQQVQAFIDGGGVVAEAATKPTLELDTEKYLKRAAAKNQLMAEMAAMNVGRIKNGTWTVAQLTALMQDEQIKVLIAHMETLSFELAIGVIQGLTNPLITAEIKSAWTARLVAKL
jgi:hypothetical protein